MPRPSPGQVRSRWPPRPREGFAAISLRPLTGLVRPNPVTKSVPTRKDRFTGCISALAYSLASMAARGCGHAVARFAARA